MKRATLFKPGFKAIYFENIIKKMNIRPEPENRKGRGTNFSNFLLEKNLNFNFEIMKGSWSRLGTDTSWLLLWFVGMQIPIIFGIMEYAMLLTMKRNLPIKSTEIIKVQPTESFNQDKNQFDFDNFSKKIDKWTLIGCLIYIIIFTAAYWTNAIGSKMSLEKH